MVAFLPHMGNHNGMSDILSNYEAKCRKAADYIIDTSKLSPEEASSLVMHYAQMEIQ